MAALAAVLTANAQLPKWMINPVNDTVFVKLDNSLLQTVENGTSALWTMDGKKVYTTQGYINAFSEGLATVTDKRTGKYTGFVNTQGRFTALPDPEVAFDNTGFENGILTCAKDGKTIYYTTDGTALATGDFHKSYPFHRSFAPFLTYSNPEKNKDPHYGYITTDGSQPAYYTLTKGEARPVDPRNIQFLSGIASNGRGLGVIKDRLYWFDTKDKIFVPFLWGPEELKKKRHLTLAANYENYFLNLPNDTVCIIAKYGKNSFAQLKFDTNLLPVEIALDDTLMTFRETVPAAVVYKTPLTPYGDVLKGLEYRTEAILPPQFSDTGLAYGNRVFVKSGSYWGVLEILPQDNYRLRLNKGRDVAFRHQRFETQLRLDLPEAISAKDARIDIPGHTGLYIDKTSRETKDTESGNFVTYNCVLGIPGSLPDTITTLSYSPVTVSYEGLKLFDTRLDIKAWHLKYYNVDPIDSETSISNGLATFTLNINAQKNAGESDYPFDVRIEADSINVEYEKLSETRYKCLVSNLLEGNNNLNIIVTEQGCPPSVFPFEIYYTRPVAKSRKKEEVIIRKKSPLPVKHTPRLEI